jgi:hypothetical protein
MTDSTVQYICQAGKGGEWVKRGMACDQAEWWRQAESLDWYSEEVSQALYGTVRQYNIRRRGCATGLSYMGAAYIQ